MVDMAKRFPLLCAIILGAVAAVACKPADTRPVVVLYVSADEYVARQIVEAFEAKYPYRVEFVGDSEAQKTTGLVNRLRREKDRPIADVFWSSEVFQTIALAKEGVLMPFEPSNVADWPTRYRDPEHHWYGFAARARVIVYASDRISTADVPESWMQLVQPQYKGRIVMADPRFGTTGGHLAVMRSTWNRVVPGAYGAFLEGLASNEVRMLPGGNAAVVDAVARGEADLGMTDTDDVWAGVERGFNVDLVYPRHVPDANDPMGGTLLIPNTVAKIAGGPNPEVADVLIEFFLSAEVETLLAQSVSGNVPIRPGLAAQIGTRKVPNSLRVDFGVAASQLNVAIDEAMKVLGDAP